RRKPSSSAATSSARRLARSNSRSRGISQRRPAGRLFVSAALSLCRFARAVPRSRGAAANLKLLRRVLGDGALVRRGFVLERGGMRNGDAVVAGIDEVDVAGHAGREVREQIERGAADLVERHAPAQRRVALLEGEHLARVADAGAGERADRPSRYGVDADGGPAEA